MANHIIYMGGDVKLMFQPDLKKLSLMLGIGGLNRTLTDEEMISLSRALWYAAKDARVKG